MRVARVPEESRHPVARAFAAGLAAIGCPVTDDLSGARQEGVCLSNFLDVLLVIFIPWSAVNLTDYFVVRRGTYDVASFFSPGGTYGNLAWRGLLAYAIGLAAEWPFVSQPDYTGPLVRHLGGADVSWVVGWFVAAIAYLLLMSPIRKAQVRG